MRKLFILVLLFSLGGFAQVHRSRAVIREFRRTHPCPATGKISGPCPNYVVDHKWPLCARGKDSLENLQWQEKKASLVKDKEEWRICRELKNWEEGK